MNAQSGIGYLAKLIGTKVRITADGWAAVVDVHDVKQAYGVARILVSQDGGTARWIDASRVTS